MINNIIVIAVRLKSQRLKKKALLDLNQIPLVLELTNRLIKSKLSDLIIWCTSTNKNDDPLIDLAKQNNIISYRGSELDVMSRFIEVAKKYNAKNLIRVTGDNPLTDPLIIDEMIKNHELNNAEYTYCDLIPVGTRSEVMNSEMLIRCHNELQNPNNSEYMTWMLNRPDKFMVNKLIDVSKELISPDLNFTVDTNEEYENINYLFQNFYKETLSLQTLIEMVRNNNILKEKFIINIDLEKEIELMKSINVKFRGD